MAEHKNGLEGTCVHVGTSAYSIKEWKGIFYPIDLPASEMLRFYAQHFQTVEINNTFYRMPKPEMFQKWNEQVPPEFKFILKASQRITHIKRLKDVADSVSYLFETAATLGDRLGGVFFQTPPNFKKDMGRLTDFLALLPPRQRCAFEFRHETWFSDDVYEALRGANAALCIADADDECTPFVSTADWGYVRLRRTLYTPADLDPWAERVRSQGWNTAYVFFKHEDEARGPMFAGDFIKLLDGRL